MSENVDIEDIHNTLLEILIDLIEYVENII